MELIQPNLSLWEGQFFYRNYEPKASEGTEVKGADIRKPQPKGVGWGSEMDG